MSLNRASSLATTSSLALSRRSLVIGSSAQATQPCKPSSIRSSGLQTPLVTLPTTTARHSGICTTTSTPRFSSSGEYPGSPYVKRPSEPSQKPENSSALSSGSEIPQRYTNSFGEVGVIVSHGGRWSTRGCKEGGFSHRLAFDKDLVTALLSPTADCLKVAAIAQGTRYNVDKWPNAEDVEGLALGVEWVKEGDGIEVVRSGGGEEIVVKEGALELWEDGAAMVVS